MPSPRRTLTLDAVHAVTANRCFAPQPVPLVGLELEWLTYDRAVHRRRVVPGDLRSALPETLPGHSAVTFEPGGQLELSTPPEATIDGVCAAAAADLTVATTAADKVGAALVGLGADPVRPPRRVLDSPRYEAMQHYFGGGGPAGMRMMCNTAAVHLNIGLGPADDDAAAQWRLANDMGPVLAAAFANSPIVEGRHSGFQSTRLAAWWAMDQTRTAPVGHTSAAPASEQWTDYVLDANVMLIRCGPQAYVPMEASLPFRTWMADGHELGYPTADDLEYHMTTLFPPVRPRGWLELRMVDALPDPLWQVPFAVAAGLLLDAPARQDATAVCKPVRGSWLDAMCTGLADPALATAAGRCFELATEALRRLGARPALVAAVEGYAARYVANGRTPADDRVLAWAEAGQLLPVGGREVSTAARGRNP